MINNVILYLSQLGSFWASVLIPCKPCKVVCNVSYSFIVWFFLCCSIKTERNALIGRMHLYTSCINTTHRNNRHTETQGKPIHYSDFYNRQKEDGKQGKKEIENSHLYSFFLKQLQAEIFLLMKSIHLFYILTSVYRHSFLPTPLPSVLLPSIHSLYLLREGQASKEYQWSS